MLWTIVSERDDPPETQHPDEGSVAPRFMGRGSSLGIPAALCDGRLESAGINRQEAENEKFSRERSSDPLGPEFCAVCREACREA